VEVEALEYDLCGMSQIQGDTEWPFSFMMMIAKLFNTQATKNEDGVYTGSQASPHIGHTITDKNGIAQINAQLIARSQQQTGTRLATETILIFSMGTIVYFLN
jgi:hypothetical protein